MRDAECVAFLQWALPRMGLRWEGFRKPRRQVCRRIARRTGELGLAGPGEYRRKLEAEAAGGGEWAVLDSLCRVTISRFFRDREVWRQLGREVLPELARRAVEEGRAALRVWSAGCASGEEPYSLAILWRFEAAPRCPDVELAIVSSDFDEHLLGRARRAVYPAGCLREVPAEWKRAAFEPAGDPADGEREDAAAEPCAYRLRPELRRGVTLRREDVRRSAPPGRFDLVLCRNLAWTYFDEETRRNVLAGILAALRPGGVLVTGGHESLAADTAAVERLEPIGRSLYRRR